MVLAGVSGLSSAAIAAIDFQGRWHTPGREFFHFIRLWMYWSQWALLLWIPVLVVVAVRIQLNRIQKALMAFVLMGSSLWAWAGLVEPHMLLERHTRLTLPEATAPSVRIAVVADIHWGLFVRDWQVERLVQRLQSLSVDAVVVAGDWTYEPPRDLDRGFSPFKRLQVPVFAVLGNHDVEQPGPPLSQDLRAALIRQGIQLVEGQVLPWRGWTVVGLDDLWGGQPDRQIARIWSEKRSNVLLVTHQPDTITLLPEGAFQLALAGHTHGGQIQLPWLTERVLQRTLRNPWYDGLFSTAAGPLFVTSGIGMIGLPMRLRVPPRIEVLTLETGRAS